MSSTQLICPTCAHENRDGARFCAGCGGALLPRCADCGAELLASARFCDTCGAPVHDEAGVGAGRKVVTVLFADLAGSTALQEALDAESVRSVMARFYGAMRAVIERYEGRLEKFIGDAVVAVFGAPVVREDDALRAVRAAAQMTSALADLNEQLERDFAVRLDMRIGVNTGELVVAQGSREGVGEDSDIVVGDVMNTAARLEQAAGAGEALIGEGTRRLVRHAVQLEPVAPLELKGKSEPVRAFRLISAERPRGDEEMTTQTPLVGRQSDLERLRSALKDAIGARACRLVTVIGSPGVGKTRLAQEFSRAIGEQAIVVEGHCEPSGEGITLLPVAEVLRSLASIGEADSPQTVRAKLDALVGDDSERERLGERVAGVLGLASPSSAQETFWALRRGLELVAQRKPMVIVLDDLHWGQPMFLDLVEHLIEWVSDAPILLLALARPELREIREALAFAGRRAVDVIELSPLDEAQSKALVSGLLGGAELPGALAERILHSSEGNPLFLGEMLRMLIDEGALTLQGETWVSSAELSAVEVPPSIHALLSARIERLGADERSVVERAAVIGKEFYRGAVAELVAPPIKPRIDGHLEALRRKDMVEPDGSYWIDEPVYRFHHVLIRDAAYRSLLKEARAELHERFADWLKEKAGELVGEHEEVIAYHLEQAHSYRRELGPLTERGRSLGKRAAERLHSAGQRALAREDLAAASNLLARALECDGGSEQEILWDLCEALLSAGDASRAQVYVERFCEGAGTEPRQRARAQVLQSQIANLAGAERDQQTLDDAPFAEAVEAAAVRLAELGDRQGEAKAWQVAAGVHVRRGRVGAVEEALDQALAAARAADDRRRITAVLTGAPRAALWGPSPVVRASGRCLDVVRILRMTPGNRHVEAIALRCQAVLEAMRGRYDAAREILAGGRATLEELGLTLELQESALHAGMVELLAGDPRAAADHLREARDGFQSLGVAFGAAQAAALLARALVEQTAHEQEAIEQTRFAEENCGADLKTTITWHSARAQALAREGQLDEALALARRAVDLAQPTDALADKADAAMALAQILLAAGQQEDARGAGASARALYEAKGHTVGAARAAQLVGRPTEQVDSPQAFARTHAAGQSVFADRAPERFWATFQARSNARDYEALAELIGKDWEWIDHRALGWENAHGHEQAMAIMRSTLDASPDIRMEFDRVLACDERVIAVRMAWRGEGRKAGDLEVEVGAVMVIEDGLWRSVDFYEPEEPEAILARYHELGGRHEVLGTRAPERFCAAFCSSINARDYERVAALVAPDWECKDHRPLAWNDANGREQAMAIMRSVFDASPDINLEHYEVLACDERVIAVRMAWRGEGRKAGDLEVEVGAVMVIEDGLWKSVDYYEPGDRQAMLARFHELGGRREELGARAPERFMADYLTIFQAQDLNGLLELLAEDCVLVDHRKLGWDTARGRSGAEEQLNSMFTVPDLTLRVDRVHACDERVIAMSMTGRGHTNDGGGEFEIALGVVNVIEDGQLVSTDYYEPEDHQAMVARYAQLGGGQGPLGDKPPERHFAEYARHYATRDLDGLVDLFSEDLTAVDHRKVGWEEVHGRDGVRKVVESVYAGSPDVRFEVDEVLACDERVIAMRVAYRGHVVENMFGSGEVAFEYLVGYVSVVQDGRGVRGDFYDYDDREAMLTRYVELGGRREALEGLPPERFLAEFKWRYDNEDLDGLLDLHAEDWVLIDRRKLGWEEVRGRDGAREWWTSIFAGMKQSIRADEILACDERVIAIRFTFCGITAQGGGEYELPLGAVLVVENDRWVSSDLYAPEERQTILARYAQLGGGQGPLGERAPERYFAGYARRYAARDIDGLLGLVGEDFTLVDHRAIGWESVSGHEAVRAGLHSVFTGTTDTRLEIEEVLACDERVIALRASYRGHATYGDHMNPDSGEYVLAFGYVAVIEHERCVSTDQYEPDDREAMLARYAELTAKPL